MKLTIEHTILEKALDRVQGAVERHQTMPILGNVKLTAGDNQLGLMTTNSEIVQVDAADATIEAEGATTIPFSVLADIVKKLDAGTEVAIDATEAEGQATLVAGRASFSLQALAATNFPEWDDSEMPHRFSIGADELKRLFERTRFAASTSDQRHFLNGVYMHVSPGENGGAPMLKAVATDGHRLARIQIPAPDGTADMPGFIIPRKTVDLLYQGAGNPEGSVEMAVSDTAIQADFGNTRISSKLIDGTYPEYERVIPTDNDKVFTVDSRELMAVINRMSIVAEAVRLKIASGTMTVSAKTAENSGTEDIETDYAGDAIEISFNARYLMDIIQQLSDGKAEMLVADSGAPMIIRDPEDDSVLYVLMPMRI